MAVGSLVAPLTAFAAPIQNVNQADLPPGQEVTLSKLSIWIRNIADFLIGIGIVVAVIFIVWGGIGFMMAGGDTEKAGVAKTRLWNGIIGALIVLGVGLILRTLNSLVLNGITF